MGTTEAQLGQPMGFTTITYRSVGEKLLKGAEMTQIQLHQQSLSQQR